MTSKTNAARLLDREGCPYALVAYEADEDDLSAAHLAEQLALPPERIFKTLVLHGDKSGYFVCIIPGNQELDLKKTAAVSANKHCGMIPMKDLQAVTGYIRGGCSPIGMKKNYPSYLDAAALQFPDIYVSAGRRGLQLRIAPSGLVRVCGAVTGKLTRDAS